MGEFYKSKKAASKFIMETSRPAIPGTIDIKLFRKGYLWGFTNENPHSLSRDTISFVDFIKLVAGENGTITIGASLHPYQLIGPSGTDIWENTFNHIRQNNSCDCSGLVTEKRFFHFVPAEANATPFVIWTDNRLLNMVNPEFSKFVPFTIPYLSVEDGRPPLWAVEISSALKRQGNANAYIEKINSASKFFLPESAFIVGFGEFDKRRPGELVDHYVRFLERSIRRNR